MPYYASSWLTTGFSAGLLVMVLLGAAVSIVRIIRIDPLDAIGGRA
jgi:putative ABC transport system permease protein